MRNLKLLPRCRRPSPNTLLGIRQAKRRIKKATGIAQVERVLNTLTNPRRRALPGWDTTPSR